MRASGSQLARARETYDQIALYSPTARLVWQHIAAASGCILLGAAPPWMVRVALYNYHETHVTHPVTPIVDGQARRPLTHVFIARA